MASVDRSAGDTPFRIDVTIAAPADAVWQALRDPAEIRRWHGWEDPSLDAEIEMIFLSQAQESDDQRTLVTAGGDIFEVEEIDERETRLRVTRGPRDPASAWDAWYEEINEGWTTFVQQLRLALERHRGAERRTIHYSGQPLSPGSLVQRLGMDALDDRPVGGRYEFTLLSEQVHGEVWYRSAHQIGLTVDGWGDGLVVVGEEPPTASRPTSSDTVVLTTYGLPQSTLDDLRRRWDGWWSLHHATEESQSPLDQSADSAAE
jgi:hypothetical protein